LTVTGIYNRLIYTQLFRNNFVPDKLVGVLGSTKDSWEHACGKHG